MPRSCSRRRMVAAGPESSVRSRACCSSSESGYEDTSPDVRGGEWWHTLDAVEWKVQAALIWTTLAVAILPVALPASRRYYLAIAAAVVGLATFCAWGLLIAPLG